MLIPRGVTLGEGMEVRLARGVEAPEAEAVAVAAAEEAAEAPAPASYRCMLRSFSIAEADHQSQ